MAWVISLFQAIPKAGAIALARLRAEALGPLAALFILSITKEAAAVIAWFMRSGPSRGIFGAGFRLAVPSFFIILF